jgi:predicted MPP superfamily phosphohydrolase
MLSRRQFLHQVILGSVATGTGLYAWRIEPHWVEFVQRHLPVRGLPDALNGRTLIHLTDIHVGRRVDDAYVIDVFQRVAALRPDIVVITGDFVSFDRHSFEQMKRVYRHLPCGRLGTFGVLGNHDYGSAWKHPEIAQGVVDVLAPFGLVMLRNEVKDVGGLQIVGLDDLWAHQFDPARAIAQLDPKKAALALSHNPDSADEPGWDGFEGWILSGHTHGGQCKPPFLPPPLLPVRNRRYSAGEIAIAGNRRLYINRGVGHLFRVRMNVRPEVTVFELCGEGHA